MKQKKISFAAKMHFLQFAFIGYCKVSNRCGVWNSKGGWKKNLKLIVGEGWVRVGKN